VALIAALYGRTLFFGFDWDDYHFVRSYSLHDVVAAFVGPWDAFWIEAPYYRPAAIALFAARSVLGGSPVALHALSLIAFIAVVLLVLRLLRRLGASRASALVGAVFVVVNPVTPAAMAVWITDQMHLAACLVSLAALIISVDLRGRERLAIALLAACAAAAMLLKEDGVMLPFAILATGWMARRSRPSAALVGVLLAEVFLYLIVRTVAIGGFGGEHRVARLGLLIGRFIIGPLTVAAVTPPKAVSVIVLALAAFLAASVPIAWRHGDDGPKRLMMLGAILLVLFGLPFALVAKPTQDHMLVVAGAIVVAGVTDLARSARGVAVRRAVLAALALWFLCAIVANVTAVSGLSPCSPETLAHDRDARSWGPAVPAEMRARLEAKRCAAQR
jgi:hypothetical protein